MNSVSDIYLVSSLSCSVYYVLKPTVRIHLASVFFFFFFLYPPLKVFVADRNVGQI